MGAIKKGLTGVGISLAIGAGGYAAEQAFETPPEVAHEMYMDCMRLDNDLARNDCIDEGTEDWTWPGVLEVAGGIGLAASGFMLYEGLEGGIRRRSISRPTPPAPPSPPMPPSPPSPLG